MNKTLQEIQDKIILPARLPEKQRKIVFNPSKRNYLEQNPIVIEVEGLEHSFSTIDRSKDVPGSRNILNDAVTHMETKSDWDNLPYLLNGYRNANIKLRYHELTKIARIASDKGFSSAIIECAKQAEQTGFFILTKEVMNLILSDLSNQIATAGDNLEQIQSAVKTTELLLDIVQRPSHKEKLQAGPSRDQLQFSLTVRGHILFVLASHAKAKLAAGEPADQEIAAARDAIETLGSLWEPYAGKNLNEVPEFPRMQPKIAVKGNKAADTLGGSLYVKTLARNMEGIRLAGLLARENPEAFSSVADKLNKVVLPVAKAIDSHLTEVVPSFQGFKPQWAEQYTAVVGRKPEWSK